MARDSSTTPELIRKLHTLLSEPFRISRTDFDSQAYLLFFLYLPASNNIISFIKQMSLAKQLTCLALSRTILC